MSPTNEKNNENNSEMNSEKKCQRRFKKPFFWLIVLGIVLGGGIFIFSLAPETCLSGAKYGWPRPSPEKKAEFVVAIISDKLDLTAEQKKKVNRIKSEILAKRKEFKGIRQEIISEVKSQIKRDKVDEAKLNQLFAGKEAHFKTMRQFLISKFSEFHSILTQAQKEKLLQEIDNFHIRHKK